MTTQLLYRLCTSLIIFTSIHYSTVCQCYVTESELVNIYENSDAVYGLTGIWMSEGDIQVYINGVKQENPPSPSRDYFTLTPKGYSYILCSNKFTENHRNNASIQVTPEGDLVYSSLTVTDEPILAKASYIMTDSGVDVLQYDYDMPPKMNFKITQNDSIKIRYVVSMTRLPFDYVYTNDEETQSNFSDQFIKDFSTRTNTPEEEEQIKATLQNTFASKLRTVMDNGEINTYIGGVDFPESITKDNFTIITVNSFFYDRVTYMVLFKHHNNVIWEVDYQLDNNGDMIDIICFNKSTLFNKKAIDRILNDENSTLYWR